MRRYESFSCYAAISDTLFNDKKMSFITEIKYPVLFGIFKWAANEKLPR